MSLARNINKIGYSPSLSCLAESKDSILSLYDSDNIMEIVPEAYAERGMISKDRAKLISRDMNLSDMDSRFYQF